MAEIFSRTTSIPKPWRRNVVAHRCFRLGTPPKKSRGLVCDQHTGKCRSFRDRDATNIADARGDAVKRREGADRLVDSVQESPARRGHWEARTSAKPKPDGDR